VTITAYACDGRCVRAIHAGMSSTTISTAVGKRSAFANFAVVGDVHAEADFVRDAREMKADVAGADDVQLW